MENSSYILEACVDSLDAAIAAEKAGANRLELCSALELGGITPSIGLIGLVCESVSIPVQVLLRPRTGNFVYSQGEVDTLCHDAVQISRSGAAGIVTGALDGSGGLAKGVMGRLREKSELPLTFHRAFDHARNPFEVVEELVELGVERILTSGQKPTAMSGVKMLWNLQQHFGQKIIIMPGGGISAKNISRIASLSGCREFHFSAIRPLASPSTGPAVGKGGVEDVHFVPDQQKVAEIRKAILEREN